MRIGWELLGTGFWSGENWLSIAHQTIVGGENWVSVGLEYFELVRIEWALHLEPLEVMRIGWALDFNNLNWWELGEHWTLTIWTGENWVSIGLWQFERVRIGWALDLEPFEVVRTEWTMDFQIQYIGDVLIGDWGLQATQSKWSRLQREVLKKCGCWLGAVEWCPGDLLSQLWLNDYSPMTASGVLDNTLFQVMTECLMGTKPLPECSYIHFIPNYWKTPNIISNFYFNMWKSSQ